MSSFAAVLHLAQDVSGQYDEMAIVAADGTEADRVFVDPAEDHAPYVDALAEAGWTLTSPVAAPAWTVTRTAA